MTSFLQGGSNNINLDTDRLVKCGYIQLTEGVTETIITEAGKKKLYQVPQMVEQAESKQQTARKSTTSSSKDEASVPSIEA